MKSNRKWDQQKGFKLSCLALAVQMASGLVIAGPEGGTVTGGTGTISNAGNTTTITQQTDRMAIDWQSYDVAANERVQYIQPSSSSISLNRILSNRGSQIHGQIDANGQVFLINPHGIIFGEGASVNVGGLLASGLNIRTDDFINGEFALEGISGTEGTVVNHGLINAALGGSVSLVGKRVENHGLIAARLGRVNLAAGNEAVLTFDQSGLMGVRVSQETLESDLGVDAAVINSGRIDANGGQILLTGSVSEDIFSQAVNHEGQAKSVVVHEDGSFTLGSGGDVVNTGLLSVSRADGAAGSIVAVGENVTSSGELHADGAGGHIELHANDTTLLTDNAVVSANSSDGIAGEIRLLGYNVGLFGNSVVNAQGALGGGDILIGGGHSGKNPLVRNAEFTFIGRNTITNASATSDGDGGRIIAFAANTLRSYGHLAAQSGMNSGNGGFIETSGLQGFEITSTPSAGARNLLGFAGEWLIDPYNITISGDTGSVDPVIGEDGDAVFRPTSSGAVINIGKLLDALQGVDADDYGSNVTIYTASDDLGEAGDILFQSNLVTTDQLSTARLLTLNADNDIYLNGYIDAESGQGLNPSLSLNFNAANNIVIGEDADILTPGGTINFHADNDIINNNSGLEISAAEINFIADYDFIEGASAIGGSESIVAGDGFFADDDGDGIDGNDQNGVFYSVVGSEIKTFGAPITIKGAGISLYDLDTSPKSDVRQNGGDVTLITHAADVVVNNIVANGWSATSYVLEGDSSDGFNGGKIIINAAGVITAEDITSRGGNGVYRSNSYQEGRWGGDGGVVELASDCSVSNSSCVTVATIDVSGGNAAGDDSGDPARGGHGGSIQLTASQGSIFLNETKLFANGGFGVGDDPIHERNNDGTANEDKVATEDGEPFNRGVGGEGGRVLVTAKDITLTAAEVEASGGRGGAEDGNSEHESANGGAGGAIQFVADSIDIQASTALTAAGGDGGHFRNGQGPVANGGKGGDITFIGNRIELATDFDVHGGIPDEAGSAENYGDNGTGMIALGGENGYATIAYGSGFLYGLSIENYTDDADNPTYESGSGTHTLAGPTLSDTNAWEITGLNTGTLNSNITFSNIGNLVGGDNADVFTLQEGGRILGSIKGGAGEDKIVGSDNSLTWALNVEGVLNSDGTSIDEIRYGHIFIDENGDYQKGNSETVHVGRFEEIEILTGGWASDTFYLGTNNLNLTIDGGDGDGDGDGLDTIIAETTATTFTINGDVVEQGSVVDLDNNWTIGGTQDKLIIDPNGSSSQVNFSGIENVTGGKAADTFTLAGGSTISLNGGEGIDELKAAGGNGDANNWTISGGDSGNLNSQVFAGIENLTGSDADDVFTLSGTGAVSGTITGGGGTDKIEGKDIDSIWLLTSDTDPTPTLFGKLISDGDSNGNDDSEDETATDSILIARFEDIETLQGATAKDTYRVEADGHQLTIKDSDGENAIYANTGKDNAWAINDTSTTDNTNDSHLTTEGASTSIYFEGVQQLYGGGDTSDDFTVSGDSFTGVSYVNGMGGAGDELDVSATGLGDVTVALGGAFDGATIQADNIENVAGSGDGDRLVVAYVTHNQWDITNVNQGDITLTEIDDNTKTFSVSFTGVSSLQGGTGNDDFSIADGGSLTGPAAAIDGAEGANTLSVTKSADVDWVLDGISEGQVKYGTNSISFAGIGSITGNSTNDSFTGLGAATNWDISKVTGGDLYERSSDGSNGDKLITISGMETLKGGDNVDVFAISSNSVTKNIDGGNGNDAYNINTTGLTLSITDTGGDEDTITAATGTANYWAISGLTGGTLSDGSDAPASGDPNISFSGIDKLVGENNFVDTFVFSIADASIVVDGGTQSPSDTINDIASYAGVAGELNVTVGNAGLLNIEEIQGGANAATSTIYGSDSADTISISGHNAGSIGTTLFSGFGNVDAAGGNDTLTVTAAGALDGALSGGAGSDEFTVTSLADIQIYGGTLGEDASGFTDILSAADSTDLSWSIGVNSSVGTVNFRGIETVLGGSVHDSFNVIAAGVTRLEGRGGNDAFKIGEDISITIAGGSRTTPDGDTIELTHTNPATWTLDSSPSVANGTATVNFSNIETVYGNSGVDSFDITAASVDFIYGGGGDDIFNALSTLDITLAGEAGSDLIDLTDTGSVTWTIDGNTLGERAGSVKFLGMESAQGGSGVDTFNVTASSVAKLDGGDGSDIFNINADNLSFSIADTAGASDTINAATGTANYWTVSGDDSGKLSSNATALPAISFSGIDQLVGENNFVDTFEFSIADASIVVDGGTQSPSDTINDIASYAGVAGELNVAVGNAGLLNIEEIQGGANAATSTISGSANADTVSISGHNAGSIGITLFSGFGNVDAAGGNDTLAVTAAGALDGALSGGTGSDEFTVTSLADIQIYGGTAGEDASGFTDILSAADSTDLSWSIGVNSSVGTVNFRGIETVRGGSADDTFTVSASDVRSLEGLAGDDAFKIGQNVSITIAGGGQTTATPTGDTIELTHTAPATWTLDSSPSVTNGTATVNFSNIETVYGNSGADTFDITVASVDSIYGGGGNDIFNTLSTLDITLSGESGSDFIDLTDTGSVTWTIDGDALGDRAGSVKFLGMETAQGGSGVDTFNVTASSVAKLDGGAGNDNFNIDADNLSFSIQDTAGASDTINAATGTANYWTVSGDDSGKLSSNATALPAISFSGIDKLVGENNFVDTFVFSIADASIVVDGGTQSPSDTINDIASYAGVAGELNVTVGNAGLLNIEEIQGGANAATSTIYGSDNADTISISGHNAGSIGTTLFSGFGNVDAAGGNDTLTVTAAGALDGALSGGAGSDRFQVAADVGLRIYGDTSTTPSSGTDVIALAHDGDAQWNIAGVSTVTNESATVIFSGIETVEGQAGTDTFTVTADGVARIEGGGGADVFNVLSTVNTVLVGGSQPDGAFDSLTLTDTGSVNWTVNGDSQGDSVGNVRFSGVEQAYGSSGADTFTISANTVGSFYGRGGDDWFVIGSNSVVAFVDGGSHSTGGADHIDLNFSTSASWNINGQTDGSGQVVETVTPSSGGGTVSFANVEFAHGSSGRDTFNIGSASLTHIFGDEGSDTFNVQYGFTPIISGNTNTGSGNGTDVLVLNHSNAADWTLDATPTVANGGSTELSFSGIETIRGSSGKDTFTLSENSVARIEGGAGDDDFILQRADLTIAIDGGTSNADTLTVDAATDLNWSLTGAMSTLAPSAGGGSEITFSNIETINAGSGADLFEISAAAVQSVFGRGGNDTFQIVDASVSGVSLDGGSGTTNTLELAHNGGANWVLDASGGSINTTGVIDITFTGVNQLSGSEYDNGGGVDTFTINSAFTGDIASRGGADIFNINAAINGTLNGGTGADTFYISATVNNGLADSSDILGENGADTFYLNNNVVSTRISGGLSDSTGDTIFGYTTDSQWDLGTSLSTVVSGAASTTFSGIENLEGRNSAADTFHLSNGVPLDFFAINAGDAESVVDSLDVSAYELTNNQLDINSSIVQDLVNNVERVVGSGTQELTATSVAGETVNWILADVDGGIAENEGTVNGFEFVGFNSLVGSAGNDIFTFNGTTLTGDIDGAGGTNTVSRTDLAGAATWSITDENAGSLTGLSGSFSNIYKLVGNSLNDSFEFIDTRTGGPNRNGVWLGEIEGGAGNGTDAITSKKEQGSVWRIRGNGAGSVDGWLADFSGIEQLNGAQEYADTFNIYDQGKIQSIFGGDSTPNNNHDILNAENSANLNTWELDRENGGALYVGEGDAREVMVANFDSVEELIGAGGKDVFRFIDAGSISGKIYGENPSGGYAPETNNLTDTLDLTQYTKTVVVIIGQGGDSGGASGDIAGSFAIESVEVTLFDSSNENQRTELHGTGNISQWQITGENTIFIPELGLTYSGYKYLVGRSEVSDTFTFFENGALTGGIKGNGASGSLGDSGYDTIVGYGHSSATNWAISATGRGASNINGKEFSFDGIEEIKGGNGVDEFSVFSLANATIAMHLDGGDGANRFVIDSPLDGTLTAGSGADAFVLNAYVTGEVNGGAGSDTFSVGSSLSDMSLIGGSGADDVLSIDYLSAADWEISDTGWVVRDDGTDGQVNRIQLSGFETFYGSNRADHVLFNDTTFNGQFYGRGGADEFTLGRSGLAFTVNGGYDSTNNTDVDTETDKVINSHSDDAVWSFAAGGASVTAGGSQVTLSGIESLTGGAGQDNVTIATPIFSINSGAGNDVIQVAANIEGGIKTGAGADTTTLTADNLTMSIDGGDTDTELDRLVGYNTLNNWSVAASGTNSLINGTSGSIVFSGFESLTGGAQADTFDIRASLAGSVSGLGGNDVFTLASSVVGGVFGGSGNDSFSVTTTGFNIDGGDDVDAFTFAMATGDSNAWVITSTGTGTVTNNDASAGSGAVGFNGIESITSGGLADSFLFNAAISGGVDGGDGANNFTLARSGLSFAITGGADSDTLTATHNAGGVWTNTDAVQTVVDGSGTVTFSSIESFVTGDGADTVVVDRAMRRIVTNGGNDRVTTSVVIQDGIATGDGDDVVRVTTGGLSFSVDGGADGALGDKFIGADIAADATGQPFSVWQITDTNSGDYSTDSGMNAIDFVGVESLTGGFGNDRFVFSQSGSLAGVINGGGERAVFADPEDPDYSNSSADVFGDSIDARALAGAQTFTEETARSIGTTLSFTDVELIRVTASVTEAERDTIKSGNQDNAWLIDAKNSGLLTNATTSTRFVGFQNIQGGEGKDAFTVAGENNSLIDGRIDGGSGAAFDSIDYSLVNADKTITLGNSDGGITDIEGVTGYRDDVEARYRRILIGASGTNDGEDSTWTITGVNDGSFERGAQNYQFENFDTLIGLANADHFVITGAGAITGGINGGAGVNSLSSAAAASSQSFTLAASESDFSNNTSTHLLGFNRVTAADGGSDTLIGLQAQNNNWSITGDAAGSVNGTFNFSGIDNLVGGGLADGFVFSGAGKLSGMIDGGANTGQAQDSVDLQSLDRDLAVGIGNQVPAGENVEFRVTNIEELQANRSFNNTLVGDTRANVWRVTSNNAGELNQSQADGSAKTVVFNGFSNLVGNTGADTFTFVGDGRISGIVVGGEGIDTLDLTGASTAGSELFVTLLNNRAQSVDTSADVSALAVETLLGSQVSGQVSSLRAGDETNDWQITGTNQGRINSSTQFTGFANLIGGGADDSFVFTSSAGGSGELTGYIDGGAHTASGRDSADLSALAVVDVQLGGDTGMRNIEFFRGNNSNSTLRAETRINNWSISGENTGTLNTLVAFAGFNQLVGGALADTYQVATGGAVTGSIQAGQGDDRLELALGNVTNGSVRFLGGAGTDSLLVSGGNEDTRVSFTPETLEPGVSQLVYANSKDGTQYSALFSETETLNDTVVAASLTVNDTANADDLVLRNSAVEMAGSPTLNYSGKQSLLVAADANDTVTLSGAVVLPGRLTIENAAVSAEEGSVLRADSLLLDGTGAVGDASNRVHTDINQLLVSAGTNPVFLAEANQLGINELSTSGLVDIIAAGNIFDNASLTTQGESSELRLVSTGGSISLDNNNSFAGEITLAAADDVTVNSVSRLNIAGLTAQHAVVTAQGNVTASGPVVVDDTLELSASGNLAFTHADNSLGNVSVLQAGDVSLLDKGVLTLASLNASGNVATTSNGLQVLGNVEAANLTMDAGTNAAAINGQLDAQNTLLLSANGLTVSSQLTAQSIEIDSGAGTLLQQAIIQTHSGGDVRLSGNTILQDAAINSSGNLEVAAETEFNQSGAIAVAGDARFNTNGGLRMSGTATTSVAGTLEFDVAGDLALLGVAANRVTVTAGGDYTQAGELAGAQGVTVESGGLVVNTNGSMSSASGDVQITSSGDADVQSLKAGNQLVVNSGGTLTTGSGIQSGSGGATLSGDAAVVVQGDLANINGNLELNSSEGNIDIRARVAPTGEVMANAAGNIVMAQTGELVAGGTQAIALTAGGDILTSTITASEGDITLTAGGGVMDSTAQATVSGKRLVIASTNGVGEQRENGQIGGDFQTNVETLHLSNTTRDTNVSVVNEGSLVVEHLGNNGDITLEVLAGDIVLDNTPALPYVDADDANDAGGVSNANYDIGDLNLFAVNGSILALGDFKTSEPDIVAENATLLAMQYGDQFRKLVYYVKNRLTIDSELNAGISYGRSYYNGAAPELVDDFSNRRPSIFDLNNNGGEQLVEVEELVEVDPAIFTSVSNYFFDDVSIRLPNDQLYEDELEELAQAN
ncbi:filamentous hemagglutinin N-terminal domain-containing protein [Teredinibacter turnerae]|uniref:filamentous hemagglutinin N-terminal domain-containing protein n=1 Tax=Teredinibacter turnerae TaxID=2426 RepID=UPI0005F78894|nr:filamentous hemagglutinin N-terminal domain-containing protein [Teredinibacter turnerae]